jgi:hypothetical protein
LQVGHLAQEKCVAWDKGDFVVCRNERGLRGGVRESGQREEEGKERGGEWCEHDERFGLIRCKKQRPALV